MNLCPKCSRAMVALFQVPRCERCELGGSAVEQPVFYGVVILESFKRRGHSFGAAFPTEALAKRFAEYVSIGTRAATDPVVVQVTYAKCSTGKIAWAACLIECVKGEKVADVAVYASEAHAEADHWGSDLRLVVVKP